MDEQVEQVDRPNPTGRWYGSHDEMLLWQLDQIRTLLWLIVIVFIFLPLVAFIGLNLLGADW